MPASSGTEERRETNRPCVSTTVHGSDAVRPSRSHTAREAFRGDTNLNEDGAHFLFHDWVRAWEKVCVGPRANNIIISFVSKNI